MARGNSNAHSKVLRPGKSNNVTAAAVAPPTSATPIPTTRQGPGWSRHSREARCAPFPPEPGRSGRPIAARKPARPAPAAPAGTLAAIKAGLEAGAGPWSWGIPVDANENCKHLQSHSCSSRSPNCAFSTLAGPRPLSTKSRSVCARRHRRADRPVRLRQDDPVAGRGRPRARHRRRDSYLRASWWAVRAPMCPRRNGASAWCSRTTPCSPISTWATTSASASIACPRPSGMPASPRCCNWSAFAGIERHYPHELSGGQQQRIALARALGAQAATAVAGRALLQPGRRPARAAGA